MTTCNLCAGVHAGTLFSGMVLRSRYSDWPWPLVMNVPWEPCDFSPLRSRCSSCDDLLRWMFSLVLDTTRNDFSFLKNAWACKLKRTLNSISLMPHCTFYENPRYWSTWGNAKVGSCDCWSECFGLSFLFGLQLRVGSQRLWNEALSGDNPQYVHGNNSKWRWPWKKLTPIISDHMIFAELCIVAAVPLDSSTWQLGKWQSITLVIHFHYQYKSSSDDPQEDGKRPREPKPFNTCFGVLSVSA